MPKVKIDKKDFEARWDRAMEGFAEDLQSALKSKLVPNKYGYDTGYLKANIEVKLESDGSITISMPERAKHLEFGTMPHKIKAKGKPAGADYLAFPAKGGKLATVKGKKRTHMGKGKYEEAIFRKEVQHPGTRPYPFIRHTFHTQFIDLLVKNLRKAFG